MRTDESKDELEQICVFKTDEFAQANNNQNHMYGRRQDNSDRQ